jgi:hypothetical protein
VWYWAGLLLLIAVVAVLVGLLDPNLRRGRDYAKKLAAREAVTEDELFVRYFDENDVTPDVPGRVRMLFAKHMGYRADKMLPDDDLMFFWYDLDMIELVRDLEREFGIAISDADLEGVSGCNVRAVSRLVSGKTGRTSINPEP